MTKTGQRGQTGVPGAVLVDFDGTACPTDVGDASASLAEMLGYAEGCGTCKAQAVPQGRSPAGGVALAGDGKTDRYGALFDDVVVAKGRLADRCEAGGMGYIPWSDFADVTSALFEAGSGPAASPVAGGTITACPDWRPPSGGGGAQ